MGQELRLNFLFQITLRCTEVLVVIYCIEEVCCQLYTIIITMIKIYICFLGQALLHNYSSIFQITKISFSSRSSCRGDSVC